MKRIILLTCLLSGCQSDFLFSALLQPSQNSKSASPSTGNTEAAQATNTEVDDYQLKIRQQITKNNFIEAIETLSEANAIFDNQTQKELDLNSLIIELSNAYSSSRPTDSDDVLNFHKKLSKLIDDQALQTKINRQNTILLANIAINYANRDTDEGLDLAVKVSDQANEINPNESDINTKLAGIYRNAGINFANQKLYPKALLLLQKAARLSTGLLSSLVNSDLQKIRDLENEPINGTDFRPLEPVAAPLQPAINPVLEPPKATPIEATPIEANTSLPESVSTPLPVAQYASHAPLISYGTPIATKPRPVQTCMQQPGVNVYIPGVSQSCYSTPETQPTPVATSLPMLVTGSMTGSFRPPSSTGTVYFSLFPGQSVKISGSLVPITDNSLAFQSELLPIIKVTGNMVIKLNGVAILSYSYPQPALNSPIDITNYAILGENILVTEYSNIPTHNYALYPPNLSVINP